MIQNSSELFLKLLDLGYPNSDRDPYWWPNSGNFEVIIGAILTQNTKWSGVEKALHNLQNTGITSLQDLQTIDTTALALLIKPSGFYNTKAKRLQSLAHSIIEVFGSFEDFKTQVTREWLLNQKGIGAESADSILCYGCYREEMVADKYTHRLLSALDYTLDEYDAIKEWLSDSLEENSDLFSKKLGKELDLVKIYALFHGAIVEFSKDHKSKEQILTTLSAKEYHEA